MNWSDILAEATQRAKETFPAVVVDVTNIEVVQIATNTLYATASFDYLDPVALHIYLLDFQAVRILNTTGNPLIQAYDLVPAPQTIFDPSTVGAATYKNLFCTRLTHNTNGATVGNYAIVYNGFDITYTT